MKNIAIIIVLATATLFAACSGDKPVKKTSKKLAKMVNAQPKPKATSSAPKPMAPMAKKAIDTDAKKEAQVVPIPPEQIKKAEEILAAVSEDEIAAVDAKKKFKMLCSACHGFKGNLMVNGAKDLTKSKITMAQSVAQVYFGRGNMTPFKGVMEDAEIVAVAKYIQKEIMK